VQALRHGNAANITVTEKQPARLQLAQQMGATHTVTADANQTEALKQIAPLGFDAVIDATGVPKVIEGAFQYLKPRGRFLQFGVTPMNAKIEVNPYEIFRNDWTIVGSFALCYTFIPAIEWLTHGVIDVTPLVSDTITLGQFDDAFGRFMAGETLKVHLNLETTS